MSPESGRLADADLISALESVLLVAGEPVPVGALAEAVERPRRQVIEALGSMVEAMDGGIRLQLHDGRAQLVTAPENAAAVQRFLGTARPPALSRSALEALAVIAYEQPVTRPEIEARRGVNSDRAVQTLLARGLIEERGQRASPGRPMEYGTTFAFLEYFGLTSLEQLPDIPEAEEPRIELVSIGMRSTKPSV